MVGTTMALTLFYIATACSAFEFDLLRHGNPVGHKFFAPNDMNEALARAVADEISESEDNAGFERSQIFGGRSPSSTRRLLQEPPLKKRSVEHRLIRGTFQCFNIDNASINHLAFRTTIETCILTN